MGYLYMLIVYRFLFMYLLIYTKIRYYGTLVLGPCFERTNTPVQELGLVCSRGLISFEVTSTRVEGFNTSYNPLPKGTLSWSPILCLALV